MPNAHARRIEGGSVTQKYKSKTITNNKKGNLRRRRGTAADNLGEIINFTKFLWNNTGINQFHEKIQEDDSVFFFKKSRRIFTQKILRKYGGQFNQRDAAFSEPEFNCR